MSYCTLIWQLPIIIDLVWLLGVVWLSPSFISAFLILLLLIKFIYQLLFERTSWSQYVFYFSLGMAFVVFISEFIQMITNYYSELDSSFLNRGFGIFLIFAAYFLYNIIIHKNILYTERSEEAK